MLKPKLPLPRQIAYAVGQFGWSTPFSDEAQAYALVLLYAIPPAVLGVLPNAVLADIAEHDAQTFTAGLVFTRYNEAKVLGELAETEEPA